MWEGKWTYLVHKDPENIPPVFFFFPTKQSETKQNKKKIVF